EWDDKGGGQKGFGREFKEELTTPGDWTIWMAGWGECLPYYDNQVSLSGDKRDKWGLPLVSIRFSFGENEQKMMADIEKTSADMLQKAGFDQVGSFNYHKPGGATIHEMGTARMGRDPETSVLNAFN